MKQSRLRKRPDQSQAPSAHTLMSPGPWTLPSGQALTEFALRSGFLAPQLLRIGNWGLRSSLRPVQSLPAER